MGFALAPGLSYCEAAGRRVLLDLRRDRYFCLGAAADEAFDALASGKKITDERHGHLQTLVRSGILVDAPFAECPRPCQLQTLIWSPIDDAQPRRPGRFRILRAACAIQRAKLDLKLGSLAAVCDKIASARGCLDARPTLVTQDRLATAALAFWHAGRIVATLDQCLPVSVAMVGHCLSAGIDARLCLGVKLQPFEAHAWVTSGETVLSDRLETVRSFAPILVL